MTVRQRGTDSSGRPILASDTLWSWWLEVVADLPFKPVVVQGAWMSKVGGGASASAGYHDKGGCMDVRTRDLTGAQIDLLVKVIRSRGGGGWRRDKQHGGMDPHFHFVCGWDDDLAPGAASQWRAYLNGRDGLASNGPDYEWRPAPLVTTRPKPTEDDMANYADQLNRIEAELKAQGKKQAALENSLLDFRRAVNIRTDAARVRDIKLALELRAQGKDVDAILAEVEKADGK